MNFPKILSVAVGLAVLGYFTASFLNLDGSSLALGLLIGAIVVSFISTESASDDNGSDEVKTLYVGNLPYRANEASVRELFSQHGTVHSVRLMKDKHTGKRRGFGFVEMATVDLDSAITALNDSEFQQRTLKVREAKERPEKVDHAIESE